MPSGSLESLKDAIEVLDRAIESKRGVKLIFNFRNRAFNFCQRLYSARKKDRALSRKQYEADSPFYDKSIYDEIVVSRPVHENSQWVVWVRKGGLGPDEIEEIEK